jgi:hypothetical protein
MLYLAMGDHLELFRMQFPPMIAVLAQAAGEQAMAPAGAPASTSIVGRKLPARSDPALSAPRTRHRLNLPWRLTPA